MYELPLFPLNTVLFPFTPIRLFIFEERYKRMIENCVDKDQAFGVVMIRRGAEAMGPLAEPFPIGTSAKITEVQRLKDGRMNIVANGQERFRILSLDKEALPYLVGQVAPYPLRTDDPALLVASGNRLTYWVRRYLRLLEQAGNTQLDMDQIPQDAVRLAYMAASLVQIPTQQKQQILTISESGTLLEQVRAIYRREVVLLKTMLANQVKENGAFSLN
jgi:Lon protease-like protein